MLKLLETLEGEGLATDWLDARSLQLFTTGFCSEPSEVRSFTSFLGQMMGHRQITLGQIRAHTKL